MRTTRVDLFTWSQLKTEAPIGAKKTQDFLHAKWWAGAVRTKLIYTFIGVELSMRQFWGQMLQGWHALNFDTECNRNAKPFTHQQHLKVPAKINIIFSFFFCVGTVLISLNQLFIYPHTDIPVNTHIGSTRPIYCKCTIYYFNLLRDVQWMYYNDRDFSWISTVTWVNGVFTLEINQCEKLPSWPGLSDRTKERLHIPVVWTPNSQQHRNSCEWVLLKWGEVC